MERRLAAGWELAREPVPLPAYGDTAAFLTLWRLRPKAAGDGDAARSTTTASALPTRVRVEISGRLGEPLAVCITALGGRGVGTGRTRSALAAAKSRPVSHADVSKAVGTLGGTAFALDPAHVSVSMADGLFISLAEVKDARRDAVRAFTAATTAAAAPSQAAVAAAAAAAPEWPLVCAGCGAAPSARTPSMLRDRLTRVVVACGAACARLPTTTALLEKELARRHLPSIQVGGSEEASCWKSVTLL